MNKPKWFPITKGAVLLFILIQFVWLGSVRFHNASSRQQHLERGEICIDEPPGDAMSAWSILHFDRARYHKAVRYDYGYGLAGCACPGSTGMLTPYPNPRLCDQPKEPTK